MNTKKHKEVGLIINVPGELAREIYRESGDLPFVKFPAMITLADSIGKALNICHEEKVALPKATVLYRKRKPTPTIAHKGYQDYPLLSR